MADFPEEQYLAQDFDPASLRVADLRNLLTKHNVHYPSSAKKAVLVQIFQDDLKPKAKSILGKKRSVKPSGKGIIIVSQDRDDASEDIKQEDQDQEPEPPKTRGRKTKKKTSSARRPVVKQEESESEPEPELPVKTPRKSRKSLSEIEAEVLKSSRSSKSSKSKTSSSSKHDPDEAFSDYNPFQSGPETSPSSPKSSGSRRKTYGGIETKSRSVSRSGSSRRKSDSVKSRKKSLEGFHSPAASPHASPESAKSSPFQRFMAPLESLTTPPKFIQRMLEAKDTGSEQQIARRNRPRDDLAASEEFAPDQLVVSEEYYEPEDRTKYGWLVWLTILVAILGYGTWWRQEKIRLGYADIGEQPSIDGDRLPLIEFLRPKPNPCPSHGICLRGHFVQCEKDYVPEQHPLSFGGLVPLGVQCRPDTEKLTRIMAIADRMNEYLREKEGMVQCGTIRVSPSSGPGSVIARGFSEDQLRSLLCSEKNPSVPDRQFAEYLDSALLDLGSRKEDIQTEEQEETRVIANDDDADARQVSKTYYASTKPKMDLTCRMRIESRRLAYRFRVELGSAAALAALVAYVRGALAHRRAEQAQVAQLVQLALDKLAEQERLHYTDPVQNPQPYMATAHLRDFLLASEHSASRRTKLWQGVQRVVESNSNVRTRQVDLRGEWHRVWEWVGYQSSAPTSPMIEGKVYPALE